ncbi:MAG: ACT domain-containing protein, partial [Vicinamibacterales bacterium]
AYFGAKVIHPKTMHPAVERNIPIWIKNTFNPSAPGTMIGPEAKNGHLAKAITSIAGLAAITVEGRGQIGVSDVTARIFSALARTSANVYMISQASSQHSVTFVVGGTDVDDALSALDTEFEIDLARGRVLSISAVRDLAIIAVVGAGMRGTPGVAGRLFQTMGSEKINIVAIAQGSSELNISFVIAADEVGRAVTALHHTFTLAD